jgi:predicted alpha/beta-fold hydrolase
LNELSYVPPRWLPGGHAQTIWPVSIKGKLPDYRRERWVTPDGDFIDLDWAVPTAITEALHAPTVCLFHGLEGSSGSHYARHLMRLVGERGWRGVVVHFRGCSGEPNQLPRAYHSGDSDEIDWILRRLAGTRTAPLLAVGVSLGGNALLKWLAEQGEAAGRVICAAAAVSAPHDLAAASHALAVGANRIYTRHFLKTLIPRAFEKASRFPGALETGRLHGIRTLTEYDDCVTAPLHGFRSAADYYSRSSAKPLLLAIRTPVLVLNAANDPFLPAKFLPSAAQVADSVRLEIYRHGGHAGFVSGALPGRLDWLPRRVLRWFDDHPSA